MSSLTSGRRDAERGEGPSVVVDEEVALGMGVAVLTLKHRPRTEAGVSRVEDVCGGGVV